MKQVALVTATWHGVATAAGATQSEIDRLASAFEHDDLTRALTRMCVATRDEECERHLHDACCCKCHVTQLICGAFPAEFKQPTNRGPDEDVIFCGRIEHECYGPGG